MCHDSRWKHDYVTESVTFICGENIKILGVLLVETITVVLDLFSPDCHL